MSNDTKQKHTQEPPRTEERWFTHHLLPIVQTREGGIVADLAGNKDAREDAERIVADHNALLGISDPAAAIAQARDALDRIAKLEPAPIKDPFPEDWNEQIAACPECQRYKDHPIQQGICNAHRQPIYERGRREKSAEESLPYRMKDIARAALALLQPEP